MVHVMSDSGCTFVRDNLSGYELASMPREAAILGGAALHFCPP